LKSSKKLDNQFAGILTLDQHQAARQNGMRIVVASRPAKKAPRSAIASEVPAPKAVALRPAVEVTEDTPKYYVNHMEVTSSMHEFSLTFARVPSKLSQGQWEKIESSQSIMISADLQLLIPPTLINTMLQAISQQKDTYERQFGLKLSDAATVVIEGPVK
jgi:hypothetical protein